MISHHQSWYHVMTIVSYEKSKSFLTTKALATIILLCIHFAPS